MFSLQEKQKIANEIEKLLLSFNHPEMPLERPKFELHIEGKEDWSLADIKPNWTFDGAYKTSFWNENARYLI